MNLAILAMEASTPEYFSIPRREIQNFSCSWRKVTTSPYHLHKIHKIISPGYWSHCDCNCKFCHKTPSAPFQVDQLEEKPEEKMLFCMAGRGISKREILPKTKNCSRYNIISCASIHRKGTTP